MKAIKLKYSTLFICTLVLFCTFVAIPIFLISFFIVSFIALIYSSFSLMGTLTIVFIILLGLILMGLSLYFIINLLLGIFLKPREGLILIEKSIIYKDCLLFYKMWEIPWRDIKSMEIVTHKNKIQNATTIKHIILKLYNYPEHLSRLNPIYRLFTNKKGIKINSFFLQENNEKIANLIQNYYRKNKVIRLDKRYYK